MKKIKVMISALITIGALVFAQTTPICDVQYVSDADLQNCVDQSSMMDETVTIEGYVTFPPLTTSSHGQGGESIFIQSTNCSVDGTWSGVNVYHHTDGSMISGFMKGDYIQVTGNVTEYSTGGYNWTEVVPIVPAALLSFGDPLAPTVLPANGCEFGGTGIDCDDLLTGEPWEGVYIELHDVTVVNDHYDDYSSWTVENADGCLMLISATADSMRTIDDSRGPGLIETPGDLFVIPSNGTTIEMVRGVVDGRFGNFSINPISPTVDIIFGDVICPVVETHTRDPFVPTSADAITISYYAYDPDGTISNASICYSVDGGIGQCYNIYDDGTGTYSITIGPFDDGEMVTYYAEFTDNDGCTTTDTDYFFTVRDDGLTIYDVQYNPFGDASGYEDMIVTVSGYVVADTVDFPYAHGVVIYDGSGEYSGLWISGNYTNYDRLMVKGDYVTVTGEIFEHYSKTKLSLQEGTPPIIHSSGNPLPAPIALTTAEATDEAWESVFVAVSGVEVTDIDPDGNGHSYGEFVIDDGSGGLRVDDYGIHNFHNYNDENGEFVQNVFVGDAFQSIVGILDYTYSNYKLQPRSDDDFSDCTIGDVTDDGNINVLDVIRAVNIALGSHDPSSVELCAADWNGDGIVNVLDVIGIVQYILNGKLTAESATFSELAIADGNLVLNSDAPIAGVQLTLSGDGEFSSTDANVHFNQKDGEVSVMIFSLEGELFSAGNIAEIIGEWTISEAIVADVNGNEVPVEILNITNFALEQNFPNPFNPETVISYQLPVSSEVMLSVYNVTGQLVETLVNGTLDAGSYSVTLDASDFSSGVYFYRLETDNFSDTKKMILMK